MANTGQFSQVPDAAIQRSVFNRSHGHKTTFDAGWLIPFLVDEILPGDTVNLRTTLVARLATLLAPIMDSLFVDVFFFFVANRLVWSNWERFNGAQDNPGDSTSFQIPQFQKGATIFENTLEDYMGLPLGNLGHSVSALPFRGYNLIWNEWFRSTAIQNSVDVELGDGPDGNIYGLLRRNKRHDYFSAALPWPQRGPETLLPLGLSAPVTGTITGAGVPTWDISGQFNVNIGNDGVGIVPQWNPGGAFGGPAPASWNNPALSLTGATADLSAATAATINQIREAFQIQRLYERDARGGTRYVEILRSHFRVTSPDQRLQRPEYLGGGTIPIMVQQVPATTQNASADLGDLGAYGTAARTGVGFTRSFVEHGYLFGLLCARAEGSTVYQQGLERMWSRLDRFEFYWPALSGLGEQAILNKEIYMDGASADDDVWGYIPRYDEYRYKPSRVSGSFRSTALAPLDTWHMAQYYTSRPALSTNWLYEDPDVNRVIAVPSEPHFLADIRINMRHVRPMPAYGVPGLVDHF